MASNLKETTDKSAPPTCDEVRSTLAKKVPGGWIGRFVGLWLVLLVVFVLVWWLAARLRGI